VLFRSGKAENAGSKESPWDLVSVLMGKQKVASGDTVWAKGGTYKPQAAEQGFPVRLSGTVDKPIIVRACPGERACLALDYFGMDIRCSHVWLWGFEVANQRVGCTGLNVYEGSKSKVINLVVHDVGACGVSMWDKASDTEMYGCLDYYNGFQGGDPQKWVRGACHGVYTQNQDGTKVISDNIVFNMYALGLQVYGSGGARVRNYVIEGNICFNNGCLQWPKPGETQPPHNDNINISGGGTTKENFKVIDNYTYHQPSLDNGYSRIGAAWDDTSKDIEMTGNYFMGGRDAFQTFFWNPKVVCKNNVAYSKGRIIATLCLKPNQTTAGYEWDNNTYYGSGLFRFNTEECLNSDFIAGNTPPMKALIGWDAWKQKTGVDKNSKFTAGAPTGIWTFVRPNKYEQGRANICIYNWDLKDAVEVSMEKSGLNEGDKFEVMDAQNFYGTAVASGTYAAGMNVTIPMKGLPLAKPAGDVHTQPTHSAPEFGAFVVLKK
jgi:hypothetical protein